MCLEREHCFGQGPPRRCWTLFLDQSCALVFQPALEKSSKVQGSIPDLISVDNTAPLSQAISFYLEFARVILSRAHVSPCPVKYLQSEYKLCYNGKAPLTVWERAKGVTVNQDQTPFSFLLLDLVDKTSVIKPSL